MTPRGSAQTAARRWGRTGTLTRETGGLQVAESGGAKPPGRNGASSGQGRKRSCRCSLQKRPAQHREPLATAAAILQGARSGQVAAPRPRLGAAQAVLPPTSRRHRRGAADSQLSRPRAG